MERGATTAGRRSRVLALARAVAPSRASAPASRRRTNSRSPPARGLVPPKCAASPPAASEEEDVSGHAINSAEWLNLASKEERVSALTAQLKTDLLRTAAVFDRPIFTTALIAGDVVILDVMHKCGLLPSVPVVFMDTLHLFNETLEFLEDCERRYDFKALRYLPKGCENKKDWNEKYTSDLYLTDGEKYDEHAKVEPLNRALTELKVDAWINGRRRDHGHDRAFLDVYEEGSEQFKVNVLAHWTFRDCWDYLEVNQVPYHPLHDEGYPSIGDLQSTLPVARDKWFEYAGERSGRWGGENKTECGIHTFEKKRTSGEASAI